MDAAESRVVLEGLRSKKFGGVSFLKWVILLRSGSTRMTVQSLPVGDEPDICGDTTLVATPLNLDVLFMFRDCCQPTLVVFVQATCFLSVASQPGKVVGHVAFVVGVRR